jgi:hypothetical protein
VKIPGGKMKHHKNIEQRTFLQDRFEILIKKQKAGQASFLELTELDDIVNRYGSFREQILEEMKEFNEPPEGPIKQDTVYLSQKQAINILDKIKSFFRHLVILKKCDSMTLVC